MAMSVEARALRRSNAIFKTGVDPQNLVTPLYSNLLLTPEERERVLHPNKTASEQLEELFKTLERRVAADPNSFHTLIGALTNEPATKAVAEKIQGLYDQELANSAAPQRNGGSSDEARSATTAARGTRKPTREELMDNVTVPKWNNFALRLLKDDRRVDTIEEDPALRRIEDKLREVFRIWLEESDNPTWLEVVVALRAVKNNRLAREIEERFC